MEEHLFEEIKILCLLTSVRGGSKLFQSLTDSHSAIISLPRTFGFVLFWRIAKNLTKTEMAEKFIKSYPRFFNGLEWGKINILDRADQLGANQNETFAVDEKLFQTHFEQLLKDREVSEKNVFLCLHFAYAIARGLDVKNFKYILYHIHDIGNIPDISQALEMFGNKRVKFIFTTRHPIDGLNSCLEWMFVQNMLSPLNIYYYEVFEFTDPILKKYPGIDLKVVGLERLRHSRKIIMENFCSWLEIPFESVLLKSTIHGKAWKGNARKPLGDTLFNDAQMYQPLHFLEKNDLKILATLYPRRLQSFGIKYEGFNSLWKVYPAIFLPTHQEYLSLIKSLSPAYWLSTLKRAKKFNQNIFYLIKIGNPLVLICFYFKRVFFYWDRASSISDSPVEML